jgi:tetratricopeptide (TPR) repeat protein
LVRELNDQVGECSVWINLGVALLYCAQYRDAISCFEHVIELASKDERLAGFRPTALSNIALCALHLEDYSRGLKAAESSLKHSTEPSTASQAVSRTLLETYYARLLIEVNSLEKAKARCEAARKYAAQSKSARAEIVAAIAEGLYEVHAGNIDVGISRLTATLEKARLLRSTLRDALAAMVKAYEFAGQPHRALVYLREMMESMRQTQQENALRHLGLHLQSLGQEPEGVIQTAALLKRHEDALKGRSQSRSCFSLVLRCSSGWR